MWQWGRQPGAPPRPATLGPQRPQGFFQGEAGAPSTWHDPRGWAPRLHLSSLAPTQILGVAVEEPSESQHPVSGNVTTSDSGGARDVSRLGQLCSPRPWPLRYGLIGTFSGGGRRLTMSSENGLCGLRCWMRRDPFGNAGLARRPVVLRRRHMRSRGPASFVGSSWW
ncbi:hypothetical protein BGZ61DRAFT_485371 [Ilyonectria robusta]|uniref:uncharacterized protein n=1 Tax=Ilyonectria robusta TaxID=1079257 RepID=UPI001E8D42C3|nr:uncharacterized protein BGZ61DRAFT_485371 [Ilyonectria robusta]KAH8661236.1 hypothetical protein BGZ61DRAFT_485371 [Ilyonectria robusta]